MAAFSAFTEQVGELMRLVRRLSLETAEASGLTLNQAMLLVRLRAGARSMTDLKHELDVTTGAVTGLVDRLERLGLVRRTTGAEDRRVVWLTLTDEGARAQAAFADLWEARMSAWLDKMPPTERAHLEPVLAALLAAGS